MHRISRLIIAISLFCAGTVRSQESTGSLEGRILDSLRIPIPGANISVSGPNLQGIRGAVSDKEGYFRLLALPVGGYTITISHIAYQDIIYESVPVRLGKTNSFGDIQLNSRMVELSPVTISGVRPLIDATSTTMGANIEARTFETLPTDRNFRSILSLAPGANTSYLGDETNISGSTGNENMYFIDGINVTDPFQSRSSTNLPYNFVSDIEVKTGGYDAEYPSALGGVANVVTQSGGNELRGKVFGFFTNNSLVGDAKTGLRSDRVKDFTTYDVGFSLGGPIIRDQLWYFAAYNPSFDNKDVEMASLGLHPAKKRSHLFATKLTWQAYQRTALTLSLLGDPATEDVVTTSAPYLSGITTVSNPDPLLRKVTTGGINGSMLVHHSVSDIFIFDGSLSLFTGKTDDVPQTPRGVSEPMFADYVTGTLSGGFPWMISEHASRITAQISGLLLLGEHTIKAGAGYEDNALIRDDKTNNPALPYNISRYGDSLYVASYNSVVGTVHNRIPSLFLQDSWLATEKLRINAGLRWTAEFFEGSDGKLAQRITSEFQPRIGFTFQPKEAGAQKLFGSYGRYYEQIPLCLSSVYHSPMPFHTVTYGHNPLNDPTGGSVLDYSNAILPEVNGLKGEYFDEFTVGYEQRFGEDFKLGVRGIYRQLLQVVDDGYDTSRLSQGLIASVVGNPGEGALSFLPKFTRQYRALEVTLERSTRGGLIFMMSYLLSRNDGNYPGLYNSDYHWMNINASPFDTPDQALNSGGPLPNDRTHVFKFSGSYLLPFGLTIGSSFVLQSGTPLNNFGQSIIYEYIFLQQRGTAGRTPTIWDLNMRFTYDASSVIGSMMRTKLILDMFHLLSQREVVDVDQVHYLGRDDNGNPIDLNPTYGEAMFYQPPMSVRLGMEMSF